MKLKNYLILLSSCLLLASCSKSSDGGNPAPVPLPVGIPPAYASYAGICSQAGYGSNNGFFGSDQRVLQGRPGYFGQQGLNNNCPNLNPYSYVSGSAFAAVPITQTRHLRNGYFFDNRSQANVYFRLSLGVQFGGGSYWPIDGGLPDQYYETPYAYSCSEVQTRDFYENVALPCGYRGGSYDNRGYPEANYNGRYNWNGYNSSFNSQLGYQGGYGGYDTNQTMLYSTQCKMRMAEFRSRNPDIFCSYGFAGIFGIIDDEYLIHNICTLEQCGL